MRPTSSRVSSVKGCRSGSGNHSSSTTGRAPAAISASRRSRRRRRTATRCSCSARPPRSVRRSTKSSTSISPATSPRSRAWVCALRRTLTPSFPAQTVPEFIAYAKANPGKINMASSGVGSLSHMCGELFKAMSGVDMVHVPYRSSYLPDLFSGQVQVAFTPISQTIEYIRTGKLRALAVTVAQARRCASGHTDRRRFRAGLRGQQLVWHRRARTHADGPRRRAEQGDRRAARRSEDDRSSSPTSVRFRCRRRPPNSGNSSPRKPKSGRR